MILSITMVLVGVVVAILVLLSVQGRNIRQEVTASKVHEATGAVREKFLKLSTPINRDLSIIAKWGQSGLLDVSDTRLLNSKLIPMLESQTVVPTQFSGPSLTGLRQSASQASPPLFAGRPKQPIG